MKSAAAVQRMRFFLCLLLVIAALVVMAVHNTFVALFSFSAPANSACGRCGSCQDLDYLMYTWYQYTPHVSFLVFAMSSTLPLMFSLWLMMTKEDRALMLNPGRFRTDSCEQHAHEVDNSARLKAERVRMGLELL